MLGVLPNVIHDHGLAPMIAEQFTVWREVAPKLTPELRKQISETYKKESPISPSQRQDRPRGPARRRRLRAPNLHPLGEQPLQRRYRSQRFRSLANPRNSRRVNPPSWKPRADQKLERGKIRGSQTQECHRHHLEHHMDHLQGSEVGSPRQKLRSAASQPCSTAHSSFSPPGFCSSLPANPPHCLKSPPPETRRGRLGLF